MLESDDYRKSFFNFILDDKNRKAIFEYHIRKLFYTYQKQMSVMTLNSNFIHIEEDKSFADDLNLELGIVSCRVTLLLRSTEIKPLFFDLFQFSFLLWKKKWNLSFFFFFLCFLSLFFFSFILCLSFIFFFFFAFKKLEGH